MFCRAASQPNLKLSPSLGVRPSSLFPCAVSRPYPSSYRHHPFHIFQLTHFTPNFVFAAVLHIYRPLNSSFYWFLALRRSSSPGLWWIHRSSIVMDTKKASMRRSHRKSRNGCSQCKTRHVKVILFLTMFRHSSHRKLTRKTVQ